MQRNLRRFALFAVLTFTMVCTTTGCGRRTGSVTGKVSYKTTTLKGGNITFISTEGKGTVSTAIAEDGTYSFQNVAVGNVSITVETSSLKATKGVQSFSPPPGVKVPEGYKPGGGVVDQSKRYVPIPEKYASSDTSGLTYTVTPGSQQKDITLD